MKTKLLPFFLLAIIIATMTNAHTASAQTTYLISDVDGNSVINDDNYK